MAELPDTRQTLIQRVKDTDNESAWSEFVMIYRPAVFRFALRRGLQAADAEDVTQRVFVAVARAMQRWTPSDSEGSFRAWLLTVTRNQVINAVTRQPIARATGRTSTLNQLAARPADSSGAEEQLDWEYRRAEFRRAAEEIRSEFTDDTWQAFWMSSVEQKPIADVARLLQKPIGSIYAARSRIMRRLKQRVQRLQSERTSQ